MQPFRPARTNLSQANNPSSRDELIAKCLPFLDEVKDLTTGSEVERWLNEKYGTSSEFYKDLKRLITIGVVEEGWAANVEISGRRYRRARLVDPSEETFGFSITAVYMDSTGNDQNNPEGSFRGDYHAHPYGEFNMVVSLNEGAALAGPNGWCYGGWTAPAPGSHHYPETKGGAIIALFFLPAGRIAYNVKAPDAN
ncbi:4-hydroxylaminobenzoate lyase [Paraburkholderia sediminicola]|uniref:4-hydroxylaminobenzoate lyase n=1 Tax=Paraburkholderia sediminicola TaxID=458836 RepID=UPI0038BCCC2E